MFSRESKSFRHRVNAERLKFRRESADGTSRNEIWLSAPILLACAVWTTMLWVPWIATGVGPKEVRHAPSGLLPPVFWMLALSGLTLLAVAVWESRDFGRTQMKLTCTIAAVILAFQSVILLLFEIVLGTVPNEFLPKRFGGGIFSVRADVGMWAAFGLMGVVVVWPVVRRSGWSASGPATDLVDSRSQRWRTQMLLPALVLGALVFSMSLRYSPWIRVSAGDDYMDWTGADWAVIGQLSVGASVGWAAILLSGIFPARRWQFGLAGAASFASSMISCALSTGAGRVFGIAAGEADVDGWANRGLMHLLDNVDIDETTSADLRRAAADFLNDHQVAAGSLRPAAISAALSMIGLWLSFGLVLIEIGPGDRAADRTAWVTVRCSIGLAATIFAWWLLVM